MFDVLSGLVIISQGKRGLVALLKLPSGCHVGGLCLFLAVPYVCLQRLSVAFPGHTHLLT